MRIVKRSYPGRWPVEVDHQRHDDLRIIIWVAAGAFVSMGAVFTLMIWIEGAGLSPAVISIAMTPSVLAMLYEGYRRVTDSGWLQAPISIEDAETMVVVVRSARDCKFEQALPRTPARFPNISNGQLRTWCECANVVLYTQHINELRKAVVNDTPARSELTTEQAQEA